MREDLEALQSYADTSKKLLGVTESRRVLDQLGKKNRALPSAFAGSEKVFRNRAIAKNKAEARATFHSQVLRNAEAAETQQARMREERPHLAPLFTDIDSAIQKQESRNATKKNKPHGRRKVRDAASKK